MYVNLAQVMLCGSMCLLVDESYWTQPAWLPFSLNHNVGHIRIKNTALSQDHLSQGDKDNQVWFFPKLFHGFRLVWEIRETEKERDRACVCVTERAIKDICQIEWTYHFTVMLWYSLCHRYETDFPGQVRLEQRYLWRQHKSCDKAQRYQRLCDIYGMAHWRSVLVTVSSALLAITYAKH